MDNQTPSPEEDVKPASAAETPDSGFKPIPSNPGTSDSGFKPIPSNPGTPDSGFKPIPSNPGTPDSGFKPIPSNAGTSDSGFKPIPSNPGAPNNGFQPQQSFGPQGGAPNNGFQPFPSNPGAPNSGFRPIPSNPGAPNNGFQPQQPFGPQGGMPNNGFRPGGPGMMPNNGFQPYPMQPGQRPAGSPAPQDQSSGGQAAPKKGPFGAIMYSLGTVFLVWVVYRCIIFHDMLKDLSLFGASPFKVFFKILGEPDIFKEVKFSRFMEDLFTFHFTNRTGPPIPHCTMLLIILCIMFFVMGIVYSSKSNRR